MRGWWAAVLVVVSVGCLLLSSTSLWTSKHLRSTEAFVPTAEQIVAEPVVRSEISAEMADAVLARPDVQQAVDEGLALLPPPLQAFAPAVEQGVRELLVAGMTTVLTSEVFADLRRAVLTSVHTQLVHGQPVTFTVGQAKAGIEPQERTGLADQVLDAVPDDLGVTVLTAPQAPSLYAALGVFPALWPWSGVIAVLALAGALVLAQNRRRALLGWALGAVCAGLLFVFAVTVTPGSLFADVAPADEDVANTTYRIVTGSLITWTLWLVVIMAGVAVVAAVAARWRTHA